MNTPTETIIKALRVLVNDIQSPDGVPNACVAQAADRLEELQRENNKARAEVQRLKDHVPDATKMIRPEPSRLETHSSQQQRR